MRTQFRVGALLTALAVFGTGCAAAAATPHSGQPRPAQRAVVPVTKGPVTKGPVTRGIAASEPPADARPYAAGDAAFGLDVLRAWCQQAPQQNLVFSPATLASSLGMAYLGAKGGTAAAMARALHLPGGADLAGLRARATALARLNGPGVTVSASNALWDSRPTRSAYLNALATAYRAGVGRVPADPAAAARMINAAIAAATGGQIRDLLSPGQLRDVSWVLTAAMYLKANWAAPFDPNQTFAQPFRTASGRTVQPKFLHADTVLTATAAGWTSVVLPYQGGKLSMVALLPPARATGCATPSASSLASLAHGTVTGTVAMPKVDLRSKADVSGLLRRLGMGIAFSQTGADFTGIAPDACCIRFVAQAATLRVDEKGTVASAAAATGITPTSARVPTGPQVVFNRPYLLLITTASGEPLFLARVASPVTR